MSGAKAQKCRLFKSTDGGTTYVHVPGVTTINKPQSSRATIDMTDLDSDAMEKEKDIPDNGTVDFPINFDGTNAVHQQLLALETSGDKEKYKTEFVEPGVATVTTMEYDAFVDNIGLGAARGGKQEMALSLEVTGAVTTLHGQTAETI